MLSRGIKYQIAHLVSTQKVHRLAVGAKVMSRRYYGRRKPIFYLCGGKDGRVVKVSFSVRCSC